MNVNGKLDHIFSFLEMAKVDIKIQLQNTFVIKSLDLKSRNLLRLRPILLDGAESRSRKKLNDYNKLLK